MNRLLVLSAWRHHTGKPGLLALSILGVAIGVGVVVGIDAANSSARRAFEQSAESIAGRATHVLTSPGRGVPDSVYTALRTRHGVRQIAPVIEGSVRALATRRTLTVLGIDPLADGSARSLSSSADFPDPARLLIEPGGIVVSSETASLLRIAVDDTLTVEASGRRHLLRLVGIAAPEDAVQRQGWRDLVVMDISSAQRVLRMDNHLSRIDVMAIEGRGEAFWRRVLPPGVVLSEAGERSKSLARMTRAFEMNLKALSYLALLVGLFLVYNIVSFSVARRRVVMGRLRALGVSRSSIERLVLVEALAIGAAGTVLGLALGALLGSGLVRLVTRAINDLYFVASVRGIDVGWATWAKGLTLGLGATFLAAWGPARRASRVTPSASMSPSNEEQRLRQRFGLMLWLSAALGLAGGVLLLVESGLSGAYAGLLCVVGAFAVGTPAAVDGLSRLLGRLGGGTLWRMGTGGIRTRLSRTSVAIAALALAVASTVGIGVMVDSFRGTIDAWLR